MPTLIAVQHVAFEDLGIFAPVLGAHGYTIRSLQAGIDDLSPLVDADLAVILGGPIGVYETDKYPWLINELAAVSARVEARRPTLGVCLGAQLMATALDAKVAPTGVKEIGYSRLELTDVGHDSVLAPLDGEPVLHWHGDHFAIPEGAEHLARTPVCREQAFSLGPNLLGLQFHVEADARPLERWLIGHTGELAGAGIDPGTIRADARRYGERLTALGTQVLENWLAGLQA